MSTILTSYHPNRIMPFMKYTSLLLLFLSFFLVACSDKEDEPQSNEEKLVGYWAITHIQTIEHIGGIHNTNDKDVPPHGLDSYAGDEHYRYDVLIFDEDFVTVRGDMPSRPKQSQYDDSLNSEIEYMTDLNDWENSIGDMTDKFACPVGKYSIKGNDLIVGSLNMGTIKFTSDNVFTLDYKKAVNNSSDYRRYIYTYTRIFSLTL